MSSQKMKNLSPTVLAVLTTHLAKYQSYLELLKEPTDAKIREQVYESCAVAAYNEDFLPILSHVATAIIQVIQKAPWDATIPLTRFLNYVFNAHVQLRNLQSHELTYVESCRRKLIKYLVESRLEIALSEMFRKLRHHIENNNSEIDESHDNWLGEQRLIEFYKFRKAWRKKPGEKNLTKCLAMMDRLIKKFDQEWPQMDQDLLENETPAAIKNDENFERPKEKHKSKKIKDTMEDKENIRPKSSNSNTESQTAAKHKNINKILENSAKSGNESPDVLVPVNLPLPDETLEESKINSDLQEEDDINLSDFEGEQKTEEDGSGSEGEEEEEDEEEDHFTKRLKSSGVVEQASMEVEDEVKTKAVTPANLEISENQEPQPDTQVDEMNDNSISENQEEEHRFASVALDTDDLRLLSSRNKISQATYDPELLALYQDHKIIQTEVLTDEKLIGCNLMEEKETKSTETQCDITYFPESKEDQDKHLMSISTEVLKTFEILMKDKKYTDYTIKLCFQDENSSVVTNPDSDSRVREVIPELSSIFPGAEISGDQEVNFEIHRIVVASMAPKLMDMCSEGANLNWSNYHDLVGACALFSYLYTRTIEFSNLAKVAQRIYDFRQSRYWDGNDVNEDTHAIFLKLLTSISSITNLLGVENLIKGLKEVPALERILGKSKNPEDHQKMYAYKIIGTHLSGPPITRMANLNLSNSIASHVSTPERPNFNNRSYVGNSTPMPAIPAKSKKDKKRDKDLLKSSFKDKKKSSKKDVVSISSEISSLNEDDSASRKRKNSGKSDEVAKKKKKKDEKSSKEARKDRDKSRDDKKKDSSKHKKDHKKSKDKDRTKDKESRSEKDKNQESSEKKGEKDKDKDSKNPDRSHKEGKTNPFKDKERKIKEKKRIKEEYLAKQRELNKKDREHRKDKHKSSKDRHVSKKIKKETGSASKIKEETKKLDDMSDDSSKDVSYSNSKVDETEVKNREDPEIGNEGESEQPVVNIETATEKTGENQGKEVKMTDVEDSEKLNQSTVSVSERMKDLTVKAQEVRKILNRSQESSQPEEILKEVDSDEKKTPEAEVEAGKSSESTKVPEVEQKDTEKETESEPKIAPVVASEPEKPAPVSRFGKSKLSELLSKSIQQDAVYTKDEESKLSSIRKAAAPTVGKSRKNFYALINQPVFNEDNPSPFVFVVKEGGEVKEIKNPEQIKNYGDDDSINYKGFRLLSSQIDFVGKTDLKLFHSQKISDPEKKKCYRSSVLEK